MTIDLKTIHLDGEFAYDQTQTLDAINDGDTLVTDDGVVGFMMSAWPVAVTLNSGQFHTLRTRPKDMSSAHQEAIRRAIGEAEKLGLAIHPHFV